MKFIAWNRKTGEWLDRNEELFMSSDGVLYYMNQLDDTLARVDMSYINVWEYTGFRDVEGEDIYVGDVVTGVITNVGRKERGQVVTGRVIIDNTNLNFGCYLWTDTDVWYITDMKTECSLDTINCKVIGHVSSDERLRERYDG